MHRFLPVLLALLLELPATAADALHIRHRWFLAVFLVCAAIVLPPSPAPERSTP